MNTTDEQKVHFQFGIVAKHRVVDKKLNKEIRRQHKLLNELKWTKKREETRIEECKKLIEAADASIKFWEKQISDDVERKEQYDRGYIENPIRHCKNFDNWRVLPILAIEPNVKSTPRSYQV